VSAAAAQETPVLRDSVTLPESFIDASRAARIDLNRATLEEIQRLPIPPEVARSIYNHRTYAGYFASIYDVADVEGVTPEILALLRPLVVTMPPPSKDEIFQRYDASFRQVQQFLSEEGAREEVADEYLDMLREPRDINHMDLFDLQSFQNVSPVDAVAILKARQQAGRIENARQLRSSEGLSYWGFRNLRDYVVYSEPAAREELHGDAQIVAFDTPYLLDEKDLLLEPIPPARNPADFADGTGWGIRGLDSPNPAVITKLRLRLGNDWKGGLLTHRAVGEEHLAETIKGFASWENPRNEPIQLDEVVLGNYRIALGQGLVMDNTDYFLPRKTGYGFNVRPRGLLGDLSRSYEFALRGAATQARVGPLRVLGFWSQDRKDGLVNPDSTINKYVVMTPRFESHELAAMTTESGTFGLRRDAFRETIYGGNLKAELWTGTYVGVSGWEARYDQRWNPRVESLVLGANLNLLDTRDSELFQDYDSRALGRFRRVLGADFQTVYQNLALQGEYAKLDANTQNGLDGLLGAAPEAWIVNAYVQYENLNVLAIYRDYDVGFDNPYARAFSNDARYEQTLLGDPFRLQSPLLSWLPLNTPQMKPERGLFLSMRYRVTRNFTITGLEFDDWTRVADGQDQRRYTARFEYSPIFPLRFRLRQRFSSRSEFGAEDVRKFRGWDTRLEMQVRLSEYDELRLLYSTTKTEFAPRPRLAGTPELGEGNTLGQSGSPSQALQAALTHNINDRLAFVVSTQLYDGFLYNFEDNEFTVLDDTGFRNWFLVRSRVSDSILLRAKFTHDRPLSRRNVDLREFNNEFGYLFEGDDTRAQRSSFRVQLDYTF
jgi:DNA uptake protein ComE-like DNA-binding protein